MLRIRPFHVNDAPVVSQIIRTTMRQSNSADYPIERLQPLIDYFAPAKVIQLSHERTCLVAEVDGSVVGTAALDAAEIVTFFVLPTHQGRGIGSSLLAALEAHARAQNLRVLVVHASLTGVSFYEHHGYRRTGHVLDGTAGSQISLEKHLS